MKEIERKFLVKNIPSLIPFDVTKKVIKQAYLMLEDDRHLRVRAVKQKFPIEMSWGELCYKVGTSSLDRDEFEYDIPLLDAISLYKYSDTRLKKSRISFDFNGQHFDIDIYKNGLVICEIEFKGECKIPSWCGEDITDVFEYSNIELARTL